MHAIRFSSKLFTAPTEEPVSVPDTKNHLRVDISDDDAAILRMIKSARRWCENYRREQFVTATWRLKLERFPRACDTIDRCDGEAIVVPRPPLIGVAAGAITYVDPAGVTQTLSSAHYIVDADSTPGRIVPAFGYTWPATRCLPGRGLAVTIEYTCGYGAAAAVPENMIDAILLLVGHRYANREAVNIGNITSEIPMTVKSLLDSNRTPQVA